MKAIQAHPNNLAKHKDGGGGREKIPIVASPKVSYNGTSRFLVIQCLLLPNKYTTGLRSVSVSFPLLCSSPVPILVWLRPYCQPAPFPSHFAAVRTLREVGVKGVT